MKRLTLAIIGLFALPAIGLGAITCSDILAQMANLYVDGGYEDKVDAIHNDPSLSPQDRQDQINAVMLTYETELNGLQQQKELICPSTSGTDPAPPGDGSDPGEGGDTPPGNGDNPPGGNEEQCEELRQQAQQMLAQGASQKEIIETLGAQAKALGCHLGGNGNGNGKKVTICHIPPGNPAAAHTIVVGASAVDAHLAHGDYLGECQ